MELLPGRRAWLDDAKQDGPEGPFMLMREWLCNEMMLR